VTSQLEPVSRDAAEANQITKPLLEVAALALLAANALLLLVGLIDLAVPTRESFPDRAARAFFSFAGLVAVLLPVLAVVLATHIQPPVRRARLITQIALAEYGVSAILAVLAFLAWLAGGLTDAAFRNAFTGLLSRIAYFAIFAIAALVVFKVWRALYSRPRRRPRRRTYGQPTTYGQPSYQSSGLPSGYPPPPDFDPQRGFGPTPSHGSAGQGAPGESQPGYGQPAVPAQPAAPIQPAQPAQPAAPAQPAQPAVPAQPAQQGSQIDETQVLSRPGDEPEDIAATQRFEPVQDDHGGSPERGAEPEPPRR
jgi:hypothetical protein